MAFLPGSRASYTSEVAAALLSAANIPSSLQNLASAGNYYAYIPNQTNVSCGSLLDNLSACQGGRSFVNRSGQFVLQGYGAIVSGSSVLTFSDQRTSGTIEYDDIKIAPGAKYLRNQVIVTPSYASSGTLTPYTFTDKSSGTYGLVSETLTSFMSPDFQFGSYLSTQFGAVGSYLASHFATPAYRVESISFDVFNLNGFGGSLWAAFLSLEIGQRVTVSRTPVYTSAQTYDCLIQGINFDIQPNSWRCELLLSPAT